MSETLAAILRHPPLAVFILAIVVSLSYQVVTVVSTASFFRSWQGSELFRAARENADSEPESAKRKRRSGDARLEAAGVRMSSSTWNLGRAGICFLLVCLGLATGGLVLGAVGCVAVILASHLWVESRKAKNKLVLEQQLNQLEMQMSENSKAGLSVERSLRTCLEQYDDPLKSHLERMVNELTYAGANLSDAFANFAARSESKDAKLLASVIAVQQETGASLSDTLDFLSQSISQKQKMRQTLRSRVAEMRLTKAMVALAPVLIIAICCLVINGVADFYTTNPLGWALLGVCAFSEALGLYVLNRMSQLPVE